MNSALTSAAPWSVNKVITLTTSFAIQQRHTCLLSDTMDLVLVQWGQRSYTKTIEDDLLLLSHCQEARMTPEPSLIKLPHLASV
ncbi:hypothetical protein TNCV_1733231 [Trichonephila clavipes]|nr:hypothetical protein TNCV_1733231 [Trichonephila clavipes]